MHQPGCPIDPVKMRYLPLCVVLVLSLTGMSACGNKADEPSGGQPVTQSAEVRPSVDETTDPGSDMAPPDEAIAAALRPANGDIDEMQAKRRIRMLVAFSKTNYFLDKGRQMGATAEVGQAFEQFINDQLKTRNLRLHVLFIPVRRDEILTALRDGRGDIAAANLTITDERRSLADFSVPLTKGVSEVVVTGRGTPRPASVDDLSGRDVYVRRTSSYYESLTQLNTALTARGKRPVHIVEADEQLEDEDILEMVNAGLVPATVVDDHLANLWKDVYDQIDVSSGVTVRTGGEIAWAVRKSAPKLRGLVDRFVARSSRGTTFGNVLIKRYFGDATYLKRSTSAEEQRKFRTLVKFFRQYGGQYDLPYLLLAAQGYQESQLEQNRRSSAGAVGVMQIKPSTAEGPPVFIKGVDRDVEANIHAGAKYLRWIVDEYFKDEPMTGVDKGLFALASYNAGARRISELRRKAKKMGLDDNKWFQNVEIVAAREIGRETVQYVGNIYKYYVAYDLLVRQGFVIPNEGTPKASMPNARASGGA
jgi:membrane-bound lytic murein transglycosylase MltF